MTRRGLSCADLTVRSGLIGAGVGQPSGSGWDWLKRDAIGSGMQRPTLGDSAGSGLSALLQLQEQNETDAKQGWGKRNLFAIPRGRGVRHLQGVFTFGSV